MNCKEIEEVILTDYIDGNLTGSVLKDIEAHLASCGSCRSLVSRVTEVRDSLRGAGKMEPPSEVWEKIRLEIDAGRSPSRAADIFETIKFMAARFRPAIAAVAAVVVILAVLMTVRTMPQKNMIGQDDIISMISIESNGNGFDYDFETAEETYFL